MDKHTALNATEWKRLKSLFSEAIQLDHPAAKIFLQQKCQDAPHISRILKNMLKTHFNSLNKSITPQQPFFQLFTQTDLIKAGDGFGKFTIIDTLGTGAMGHVYLAERQDDMKQKMVVKVLRKNTFDHENQEQFDNEHRILAKLEHPNIARLIDTGTHNGQAYYAMDHIKGQPINAYCDNNNLGIRIRLELFLQVCDAVSHAHNHLIIHRNLKPNNILVSDQGKAKLLNFGTPKPLQKLPGSETLHQSMFGFAAMTTKPQYAAPEQINHQPITVKTDVYVLGLLLYELLTQKPAFDFNEKNWREITDSIEHELPELPSRKAHSDQLKTKLKGDLDAIVYHALKKEPSQRYQSVRDFAADIRNHLNHQPIGIKNDQYNYRLKKFLRRNWLAISASSIVFFTALVASLWP